MKPNFLLSLHKHSTLRVSCGLGKCGSAGGGGSSVLSRERCLLVGSPSCELKGRDPLGLSAGSPGTLVHQGTEAHCPLDGKLPSPYRGHPQRSPSSQWCSFVGICGPRAGPTHVQAAMGREASSQALTSHALCPRTRTDVYLQGRWRTLSPRGVPLDQASPDACAGRGVRSKGCAPGAPFAGHVHL